MLSPPPALPSKGTASPRTFATNTMSMFGDFLPEILLTCAAMLVLRFLSPAVENQPRGECADSDALLERAIAEASWNNGDPELELDSERRGRQQHRPGRVSRSRRSDRPPSRPRVRAHSPYTMKRRLSQTFTHPRSSTIATMATGHPIAKVPRRAKLPQSQLPPLPVSDEPGLRRIRSVFVDRRRRHGGSSKIWVEPTDELLSLRSRVPLGGDVNRVY